MFKIKDQPAVKSGERKVTRILLLVVPLPLSMLHIRSPIFFGELITNSVPAWTCHRVNTNLLRTCQAPSQDRDGFHLVSAGPTTWIDISSKRKLHAHPHFSGR